jgi:hypothetical protein
VEGRIRKEVGRVDAALRVPILGDLRDDLKDSLMLVDDRQLDPDVPLE